MARPANANRNAAQGRARQEAASPPPAAAKPAFIVLSAPDGALPDARALSRELRAKILANAHGMTDGLITAAAGGGYMAARFLFEFAGLTAAEPDGAESEETLLTLLFRRLDEDCGGPAAAAPPQA